MRKWNAVLSALVLLLFILHGVLGAFQLSGLGNTVSKGLSHSAMFLAALHACIGVKLTWDTLQAQRKAGAAYWKENRLFWARRLSGLAVLVLLVFHLFAFSYTTPEGYTRLAWFSAGKLASQLLLAAAVAVHVLANLRPLLISFGVKRLGAWAGELLFALSLLLLLMAAAFVIYYLRWNIW